MKTLARMTLVVLLAALLSSCVFPGYKIKPGDKLGDMEFINNYELCPAPNFTDICGFPALEGGTCVIPASIPVFWISIGWAEDTVEELEFNWLDSKWKMTFDGHEVDLLKFGTYDMDLEGQKARAWDVCISHPASGKHTVNYEYEFVNGVHLGKRHSTLIFTVLAADGAQTP
jgi:hypothetical protein